MFGRGPLPADETRNSFGHLDWELPLRRGARLIMIRRQSAGQGKIPLVKVGQVGHYRDSPI